MVPRVQRSLGLSLDLYLLVCERGNERAAAKPKQLKGREKSEVWLVHAGQMARAEGSEKARKESLTTRVTPDMLSISPRVYTLQEAIKQMGLSKFELGKELCLRLNRDIQLISPNMDNTALLFASLTCGFLRLSGRSSFRTDCPSSDPARSWSRLFCAS